jgi:hypothetical protein
MEEKKAGEKVITSREEEATITSGDNHVLTQQSATDEEKVVQEGKIQEMVILQGGRFSELHMKPAQTEVNSEKQNIQAETLVREADQTMRSEEMNEELLDYDEDYEPTEQEKAEMELYEKNWLNKKQKEQRAQMKLLEKKLKRELNNWGP